MKGLLIPLLFLVLCCYTESVDECGDRCRSGEVCLKNGTCVDQSDLVSCGFFGYCVKGEECCGTGCMPEGSVCCNTIFYCEAMHECCGLFRCCFPGTYCNDDVCVIGERPTTSSISTTVTTRKVQTTSKPLTTKRDSFTTRYVKTTWRPQTVTTERFVTNTARTTSTSKSSFLWWHGLIIAIIAVVVAGLIIAFLLRKRLAPESNAHASGGKVLGLNQPQVVYDNPVMASNPDLPQYYPQTGHFGKGTTSANGVTALPNMQQHLMVTKTGVPPYIIQEKSPAFVDKNANKKEHVTTVPLVNNMHHNNVHTAARPQTLPHPYANIKNQTSKKEASVEYLPHL